MLLKTFLRISKFFVLFELATFFAFFKMFALFKLSFIFKAFTTCLSLELFRALLPHKGRKMYFIKFF